MEVVGSDGSAEWMELAEPEQYEPCAELGPFVVYSVGSNPSTDGFATISASLPDREFTAG